MVYATFTDNMKQTLASSKGKNFISYECELDDAYSRTFGNMRLNFESFSIDVTNEEETLPFFDSQEDITCFKCKTVDSDSPFIPSVSSETKVIPVNKTITDIELIKDTINVNNGEYNICFDAAIIFHMDSDIVMLARDTWFSELINISNNDNYEKVFSIEEAKEAWSNDGEYQVDIQRTRVKL